MQSAIRFYHEVNLGFDSLNDDPLVYLRPDALMTYIKLNAENDSNFRKGFRQEQINMNILTTQPTATMKTTVITYG